MWKIAIFNSTELRLCWFVSQCEKSDESQDEKVKNLPKRLEKNSWKIDIVLREFDEFIKPFFAINQSWNCRVPRSPPGRAKGRAKIPSSISSFLQVNGVLVATEERNKPGASIQCFPNETFPFSTKQKVGNFSRLFASLMESFLSFLVRHRRSNFLHRTNFPRPYLKALFHVVPESVGKKRIWKERKTTQDGISTLFRLSLLACRAPWRCVCAHKLFPRSLSLSRLPALTPLTMSCFVFICVYLLQHNSFSMLWYANGWLGMRRETTNNWKFPLSRIRHDGKMNGTEPKHITRRTKKPDAMFLFSIFNAVIYVASRMCETSWL